MLIADFLDTVYPLLPDGQFFVVSWIVRSKKGGAFRSKWFPTTDINKAVAYIEREHVKRNLYFNVGLRNGGEMGAYKRGGYDRVASIPGLWADLDIGTGQHAQTNLPVESELLDFLQTFSIQPSLLVHSGGGIHAYWLFNECWTFDDDNERQSAALLNRRLYHAIDSGCAWNFDDLSDLPRVLRPVGTVNHKYGTEVKLLRDTGMRYEPGDLDDMLPQLPKPSMRTQGKSAITGIDIEAVCTHYNIALSQKSTDWWEGPHPVHGSSTGNNLNVNPVKGCWNCWRCGSGGDALQLIGVCEQLVDCKSDLKGDDFKKVLAIAKKVFGAKPAGRNLPEIIVDPDITRMLKEGEAAILALPGGPHVYQRSGMLVRPVTNGNKPKWLRRAPGAPVITQIKATTLRRIANDAAEWKVYSTKRAKFVTISPPVTDFCQTLLDEGDWQFPYLSAVITAPTLRHDGSLLDNPGYDPDTGLLYCPNGIFPPVPGKPKLDDARTALGVLQQVTIDFPFASKAHQSAAWSAILTLPVRHMIDGCTPLNAVRSSTPGSGKSLLVDAVSIIGTGKHAARWAQTTFNPDEDRKRLFAVALAGDPVLCIDNVRGGFGNPAIEAALTGRIISDRILGKHEKAEMPWDTVMFCTGNNIVFLGDTARRALPIDIDPKMENPETRTGFAHDPLLKWVESNRGHLVVAALTILRAYIEAGAPRQSIPQWGSFEAWSDLIRGALVWAGEADPYSTRTNIQREDDSEFSDWQLLLTAWEACYSMGPATLRKCKGDIQQHRSQTAAVPNEWDDLDAAFEAFDSYRKNGQGWDLRKVGMSMRKWVGRAIDKKRLIRDQASNSKGTAYRLEYV